MNLLIPCLLSIHYLLDVLFVKKLSDLYNYKKIMINSFLITFILLIFLYPKEIIFDFSFNYIYIILFSINLLFGLYIWYYAIKRKFNLGQLDGIAIAIYLPLLTIISSFIFKEKIKSHNLFGIIILAIGAYFTLL